MNIFILRANRWLRGFGLSIVVFGLAFSCFGDYTRSTSAGIFTEEAEGWAKWRREAVKRNLKVWAVFKFCRLLPQSFVTGRVVPYYSADQPSNKCYYETEGHYGCHVCLQYLNWIIEVSSQLLEFPENDPILGICDEDRKILDDDIALALFWKITTEHVVVYSHFFKSLSGGLQSAFRELCGQPVVPHKRVRHETDYDDNVRRSKRASRDMFGASL